MLVLSRRPGPKVVFPSLGVAIEVLRSRGSVTRLGIEAPDDVPVLRDDIRLHDLRVFAVSGSSRDEFGQSTLPVDGWFSKPVRIDALLQAVRAEQSPVAVTA
ncbi:MAG: carbon storage regulator [Planctomycetaceae bacterium]